MANVTVTKPGAAGIDSLAQRLTLLRHKTYSNQVDLGESIADIGTATNNVSMEPAVIICPTMIMAIAVRRSLAQRPNGLAAVNVTTFEKFALELTAAELAFDKKSLVSRSQSQLAIRAILAEQPGHFAEVASHRTTEEKLVQLERQIAGLPATLLDKLVKQASGLSADALRVLVEAKSKLSQTLDHSELVDRALTKLHQIEPGTLGPILIYLPEPNRPIEGRLLAAISKRSDAETIVAATGLVKVDEAYQRRLAGWGLQTESEFDAFNSNLMPVSAKRLEVPDTQEEVFAAVRDISEFATAGVALSKLALLYTTPKPYASVITSHLDALGLPYRGPGYKSLAQSLSGRFVQRLLKLATNGMERSDVIKLLAAAPVDGGKGEQTPTSRWDQLSRQAGIIEADHWKTRLDQLVTSFAAANRADNSNNSGNSSSSTDSGNSDDSSNSYAAEGSVSADSASIPKNEYEAAKQAKDVEAITELKRLGVFVQDLQTRLLPPIEPTWSAWSEWVKELLDHYLLVQDWPPVELTALAQLEKLLLGIGNLDGCGPPPNPETFAATLESELGANVVAGQANPEGIFVGPVSTMAGAEFERVYVVGLVEGIYPRTQREDSLLPDQLRGAAEGLLMNRTALTEIDVRSVCIAAASSTNRAVLLTSRGDLRSNRTRSWPRAFNALINEDASLDSFHYGLANHGRPGSSQELALRALVNHVARDNPISSHPAASSDEVLALSLGRVLSRNSKTMSTHTGYTGGEMPSRFDPTENLMSPTALETYASCPRKYLFQRVLALVEEDKPERIAEITSRDRGTLIHKVLERFISEVIKNASLPKPSEPWSLKHQTRLFEILEQEVNRFAAKGLTGGRVRTALLHRQLLGDLQNFVDSDDQMRLRHQSTPHAAEFSFGFENTPALEGLWAGRSMSLRGSVDRIDLTEDGGVIVIDYKAGSKKSFEGLQKNPLDDGRRLQLPLYARAVAENLKIKGNRLGLYWLTKYDKLLEVELDAELEANLEDTVGAALDGIAEGLFPGVPGSAESWPRTTFENCRFCDFDRICPTDRQSEWDRVSTDHVVKPIEVLVGLGPVSEDELVVDLTEDEPTHVEAGLAEEQAKPPKLRIVK